MVVFVTLLVAAGAFFVGTFGFPQIIGAIKYPWAALSPAKTITIWIVILLAVAVLAHLLLATYVAGLYIGYAIAFVLALGVKPD